MALLFAVSFTVQTGCGEKAGDAKKAVAGTDSGKIEQTAQVDQQFTAAEAITDSNARYTLQLKPTVGDLYGYRVTQRSNQDVQNLKSADESVYNFTLKVTSVNTDGSMAMEMRYDSIRIKHTGPKSMTDSTIATISYDSRKKSDSAVPGSEQFRVLIGQRVNLTLSKTGEVREVSNLEPILSAVLGKLRDSVPPARLEQLRNLIKVQAFASIIQQLFLQSLPDSGITIGKSWTRRDTMPISGIPSRSTVVYTLGEVRKVEDHPVGQFNMTLSVDFPKKTIDTQVMHAEIKNASVGGSGQALIDLISGMPVRKDTKIETRLNLVATAKAGPQTGKSQSTAQHELTSTLVERTHFAPAGAH